MKFPADFYEYLRINTLIDIKGGVEREHFLDIWMVDVNHRVFARSWNKSERSWFTAILKSGVGQIRYGNKIVGIKGIKLKNEPETHKLINKKYLEKYHQEENLYYANGITQPEYEDYTMEFFYDNESTEIYPKNKS